MHAIIALWEVLGGAGLLTWKQTWNLELMSHSRKSVRSSIIFYIYGVMAAPVVVNEVLNFVVFFYFKRVPIEQLCEVLTSF